MGWWVHIRYHGSRYRRSAGDVLTNSFPYRWTGGGQFYRLEGSEFIAHVDSAAIYFETIWEIRSASGYFEMPVYRLTSRVLKCPFIA